MDYYDFYDPYDFGSSYFESALVGIMMIFFIVMLVWAVFSLISYILKGVGMYTIAKRLGKDYAWLAFIPFARTYLHGELAGSIRLKNKRIQNPGIWLLAIPFLYGAVSSLLNGILWFAGGSIARIFDYASYPYGRVNIGIGSIMGIVVLFVCIMVINLVYTALYKSFQVLVDHQILERFTSKNMSIVHAVLSTFIPMYESICLFVMRNRPFNPGMEPPAPKPFMQSPPPGTYYGTPVPPPVPPMGGGYYGNMSGTGNGMPPAQGTPETGNEPSGFGNYGSSFTSSGFGNTGSILESAEPENTGNILKPAGSENTGSILDDPDEENEDPVKIEDPINDESASSVNFTLPGDEHKEL